MNKSELLEIIKDLKEDDIVNEMFKGTDIEQTFKISPTLDMFKEKLKNDKEFKSFLDSEKDSHYAKALKTMKENGTWEKEFKNELSAKYPDLIADPVQKRIAELEKQLEDERKANERKDLLSQAVKYATEKGLPLNFVDKFLGDDLEGTKANLDGLADEWSKGLEKLTDEKLKLNAYIPSANGGGSKSIGSLMAEKANSNKTKVNDPWGINE